MVSFMVVVMVEVAVILTLRMVALAGVKLWQKNFFQWSHTIIFDYVEPFFQLPPNNKQPQQNDRGCNEDKEWEGDNGGLEM